MSTVVLCKWGNSVGIRIPSAILKEIHLSPGTVLDMTVNKKGGVTLVPLKHQQKGWTEQFNAIADAGDDALLMDVTNTFDDEEWTW